jgi:uncharacterized protein YndB with AHSA1/START domain
MIVTLHPNPETTVQVRRTFATSREKVFQAWTEPEKLKKWWAPAGYSTPSAEIDLRVGGKYRVGMQLPGEAAFYVSGAYREVKPPEKLVFTWRWEKPEMDFGESLVTIEFHEWGNSTEVILTHEQLPNEAREQYSQGWSDFFDKLAEAL